jgi:hypothetical protein
MVDIFSFFCYYRAHQSTEEWIGKVPLLSGIYYSARLKVLKGILIYCYNYTLWGLEKHVIWQLRTIFSSTFQDRDQTSATPSIFRISP